jgi:hypothetical protein
LFNNYAGVTGQKHLIEKHAGLEAEGKKNISLLKL